ALVVGDSDGVPLCQEHRRLPQVVGGLAGEHGLGRRALVALTLGSGGEDDQRAGAGPGPRLLRHAEGAADGARGAGRAGAAGERGPAPGRGCSGTTTVPLTAIGAPCVSVER